ncbi:hypothetical protein DEDE109153_07050 [Deinococcus deserti]|uniref:Uncharacterized protein n=1 Tax=Deinococcus deserti (strain DSM 17065 / CIP 109153 / LMG 22923 / VCD115) TaxID=546414 RepID=C1CWR0_DEIDV|nr:hypothetical protein [Deinococcus deserti]ACO46627.1 hypothetical protein Deide_16551 [Deinococcus deserti VCD115]
MTGPKKGSRGRGPKKNTAQGRGGSTRDTVRPARERTSRGSEVSTAGERSSERTGAARSGAQRSGPGRTGGSRTGTGTGRTESGRSGTTGRTASGGTAASRSSSGSQKAGATRGSRTDVSRPGTSSRRTPDERTGDTGGGRSAAAGQTRRGPPKVRKALPELKRVQLDAPEPDTVFVDRDGERISFPESNLKRVAARILTDKNKAWRYRPFSFPLFTDRGGEQTFHFDFYIYDAEDSVIRLLLVVPFESREVWDRVGRFKRQYPMYTYELWTPEKLAQLSGPRGRLGF